MDSPALQDNRIIPADAGSTRRPSFARTIPRDHPRGCGEHGLFFQPPSCSHGSSPRMRGALWMKVPYDSSLRIIPADAGSTFFEYVYQPIGVGSSPRMRGALPGADCS